MQNLFDSDNYPDAVPSELEAGSQWGWTRSDITDAYPTASYTLRFDLHQLDSPNADIRITADKTSSAHVVEVDIATTAAYATGEHSWKAVVIRDADSEERVVDRGFLTINPDVDWVYSVLTQLRTNVQTRAASGEASYGIGGRSIAWRTYDELMALEKEFARRWEGLKRDADRKAGRNSTRRVLAKMSA
jgi:hypothetical protein